MESLKINNTLTTQLMQKRLTKKILFYFFLVRLSLNGSRGKMQLPKRERALKQKENMQKALTKDPFEGQPKRGLLSKRMLNRNSPDQAQTH